MAETQGMPEQKQEEHSGHTNAEHMAQQAAKDAGWQIRWPHIRMMSQSPDLASPANSDFAQNNAAPSSKPAASTTAAAANTWKQLRRLVSDITEVFGQPSPAAPEEHTTTQLPLDGVAEQLEDQHALPQICSSTARTSRIRSFINNGNNSNNEGDAEASTLIVDSAPMSRWQRTVDFGRRYPLLMLGLGWLAMLMLDWVVTSSAMPRLLSLLTIRPWSPFSESFVMQASLAAPGLIVDDNTRGANLMRLLQRGLLRGELWIDDFLWSLQMFVCETLVPLTQPYAVYWLAFALISLKTLRRCSKIGKRAAVLCFLCFALFDLALWRIFGSQGSALAFSSPLSTAATQQGHASVKHRQASTFSCENNMCVASPELFTPDDTHSPSTKSGGAVQVPPQNVRSPFADAVEEALARKRVHIARQSRRIDELHRWQQQKQQRKSGFQVLPLAATLTIFLYVAGKARSYSASAARACMALLAVDMFIRNSQLSFQDRQFWNMEDGTLSIHSIPRATCRTLLQLVRNSRLAFPRVSGMGCLLPVHALSTVILLGLHELAFAVHTMRVWYATTIRDRRRGPAMVSAHASADGKVPVTLDSALTPDPAKHAPPTSSSSAQDQASLSLAQVTNRAGAPYAHRVCFLCLSGYCERCLLSMSIWPTRGADTDEFSGNSISSTGTSAAAAAAIGDIGHSPATENATSANASGSITHSRRRSRGHSRTHASKGAVSLTAVTPAATTGDSTDSESRLPPLCESLQGLGLLNPDLHAEDKFQLPASESIGGSRRNKAVDVWIASSVAHCPCRSVHGVGPSSFVSRVAKLEHMRLEAARVEPSGFEPPRGTLVALLQYARELRSLGLVRPVDPASVVFGDEDSDPTSSVLPVIFGRFTMPANPRAVAAANALLASSASSYAQVLANGPSAGAVRSGGHTPSHTPFLQNSQPARILAKPTPLSTARAPSAGTFRLCAQATNARDGIVKVLAVVTPTLAHLLLTHPRTAQTAAVCVPASLAGTMAARARGTTGAQPSVQTATSLVADTDPFLDHVRVQLQRSDMVVRVNGVRWADVDAGTSLNQGIVIRNLADNHAYRICVSLCGLRSEELQVVLPSINAPISRARLAKQLEMQAAQSELEQASRQKADAAARLKRAKREMPRQIQQWRNELDSLKRSMERQAVSNTRALRRLMQLDAAIAALQEEVAKSRVQLEASSAADVHASSEEDSSASDADLDYDALQKRKQVAGINGNGGGFSILSQLDEADSQQSKHQPTIRHQQKRQESRAAAHSELQHAQAEARQQRDMLEEKVHELKSQRSSLLASIQQMGRKRAQLLSQVESSQKELAEVSKRLSLRSTANDKLQKQLQDLLEQHTASNVAAKSGDANAQLIRQIADLRQIINEFK
ncbi:hypothetical protein IWW36_002627 [Coemansia brasiliensis]|uniref:Uncharacterized protein n=1 Tax=Coemansia brasiliensis TaxID=2650707 RepID=A0A9W8I6X1_9FUNG|nr:hypothetical protein IWW36_002627 [Coemansia brasiliensis]